MTLKEKLAEKIDAVRAEVKSLLKDHGEKVISQVTVSQAYGGMRDIKCMVTETSALDPSEGIRFRGYSIPQLQEKLPKAPGGDEPMVEALFWLLLTGDIPTSAEAKSIDEEWTRRSEVSPETWAVLDALPKSTHPMTQLSIAILSLQPHSRFYRQYHEGIAKNKMWEPMFEDVLDLSAKLPAIAAYIYRRSYKDGRRIEGDPGLDLGANFAHMMGVEDTEFRKLMRLYLVLHCDHEGGNVSAHATHLVGSALSDACYALSAGMNGLAGPLHGLASQEVLVWIHDFMEQLGDKVPTDEQLKKALWDTLKKGQVIPGFGHAVLRKTDPRYIALREFALKYMPEDPLVKLAGMLYQHAPAILKEQGKAKNPWPNVDAHSGILLWHYGVKEYDFYTVLFGVSRALGVLASLIWDRALQLPLERPQSVTTEWVKAQVGQPKTAPATA